MAVMRAAPANLLTVGQPTYKIIHGSTQFSDKNSGSFQSKTTRIRRDGGSGDTAIVEFLWAKVR